MPASLAHIGDSAFYGCTSLAACEFDAAHAAALEMEANAFRECTSLRGIVLPASLSIIPDMAFADCEGLERVALAEGSVLEAIKDEAFSGCTALRHIALPTSARYIAASAFKGCTRM